MKNIAGRAAINEWIEQATAITARTGVVQQLPGWADGWFNDDHLESKLVGCVIGIYAPAFEDADQQRAARPWRAVASGILLVREIHRPVLVFRGSDRLVCPPASAWAHH